MTANQAGSLTTSASAAEAAGFLQGDSEMGRLIRSMDWSGSPLGAIESWPQSLRTTVSLCLASNFPINIIWGPQHIQIYNDGYRIVCGDKHPAALGMDYTECWASAWDAIGAPFVGALEGHTSFLENQRMFLFRNGYLEETFFTFSLSPIRDESGGIGGLFHPVTETTVSMVGARRTRALRDLTARLADASSSADVFARTIATLAGFDLDLPFVVLYELQPDGRAYRRSGCTGVAPDSVLSPALLALPGGQNPQPGQGAFWPLEGLLAATAAIEVGGLREAVGDLPCGPYDEAPSSGFALPLRGPGEGLPVALMMTAPSARLPANEQYSGFHELIAAALSAALLRVSAMEEERQRTQKLAALDRAKTEFFSNVSHEFRTPLTLMLAPLEESLAAPDLPAALRERLQIALRNSRRLLKLVNSLLDFSRIEAGRHQVALVATDLAALTAELASNFRSACMRAGLQLEVDCPPLSGPFMIDPEMWEKIVLNLMSNAFKFTLSGAITVRLLESAGQVELRVGDSGVGIPPDQLDHIFERFHRVQGQRGRSMEGTGIGLSLVRELVLLQDGSISVSSTSAAQAAAGSGGETGSGDGTGTTFTVSIPRHALTGNTVGGSADSARAFAFADEAQRWLPDEEQQRPHEPASSANSAATKEWDAAPAAVAYQGAGIAATAAATATATAAAARPARILLADDNADMRNYVRRILEEGGYQVEAVDNGLAALAAARRSPPDLVLSDVMMPGLDGFALLQALRDDPATRPTVVILLSARAGEEARLEGLAAGADEYLIKPFAARELRARVDGAVSLALLRREATAREQALKVELATQRSRTEVVESNQRLGVALSAGGLGSWELDLLNGSLKVSDTLRDNFRLPPSLVLDNYATLRALIHPDDLARQQQAIRKAIVEGGDLDIEYRNLLPDGSTAWVLVRGRTLGDQAGRPRRMAGVALDISVRKRADEQQQLLLDELNHRVKNTLSVVQSIAFQTLRGHGQRGGDSSNVDQIASDFSVVLQARIQALASAHDLLTREGWTGASLEEVAALTIAPFLAPQDGAAQRATLDGPAVRLGPNAAITLNMAFHELATNAVKYGAWTRPEGRVRLQWHIDRQQAPARVEISWLESGGPPVTVPRRRGFGSRLLDQGLARELHASVTLRFEPAGVECRISMPLRLQEFNS